MNKKPGVKIIAKNKRAFHDFLVQERIEAGLSLTGTEVKTLRLGKASIKEAFVTIDNKAEAWVNNLNIPQYEFGNIHNHQENRKRKLLLHKKEIEQLNHAIKAKGQTIVPISLYFKGSYVKIEIALAKGKKLHDKRQDQAKKAVERKLQKGNYE